MQQNVPRIVRYTASSWYLKMCSLDLGFRVDLFILVMFAVLFRRTVQHCRCTLLSVVGLITNLIVTVLLSNNIKIVFFTVIHPQKSYFSHISVF